MLAARRAGARPPTPSTNPLGALRSCPMRRVATIVAVLMLAAACGGGDDTDAAGVASLDDTAPGVSTTAAGQLEADLALLEFSQCMRDEGIALPDIGIDEDGAPILDPALLESIDVQSERFAEAFDTCQPILARSQAFDVEIDPELQAEIEDQLLKFSQCMRDNGFEDFPDPASLETGQPYPVTLLAQFSDPEFEAAVEVCQRELAFPGSDG